MGRYRPFIILGIAIIIAFVTSVLIYNYLQRKAKVKDVTLETQSIAVAKVDMNWGTVLTKEVIEMKPFLKNSLPTGHFSDPASLVGRVLVSPVKTTEPIFESKLAPTTIKTGGVAAVVSPKKRAVAVKVDKVIGVAGFIYPGNHVDVLVTTTPRTGAGQADPITKIVLQNILVLAIGQEIERKGKEEKATPVDVITLEVTPEEAEKLALAATEGKLQLALRNFSDTEDVLTKGMTVPQLLMSYVGSGTVTPAKAGVGKVVRPRPAVPEKPPMFVVQLIKGDKVSEVKVEGRE
ncbi:MAG: Flp pilus assembly protein CpaB, partial [Thermodesulfobacteriota bacterium]|nr:Flp pilus assembly protein CpaB [Thermodesulfobacteriota bacterium]